MTGDKDFIKYVALLRDYGTVADLENCLNNNREIYFGYMKAKENPNFSKDDLTWLNELIIEQMKRVYFVQSVLISKYNSSK